VILDLVYLSCEASSGKQCRSFSPWRIDSRMCSISPLMSSCIASRLDSNISAARNLIHQLRESYDPVPFDSLYVNHMFSIYSSMANSGPGASTLIRAIALLKRPVTPTLLAALLELSLKEVTALLQRFLDERLVTAESPLDTDAEARTFSLCHQSLLEFSVDPFQSRAKDDMARPADSHRDLLESCLGWLNNHLREDICDIGNPGLANADVPDLPARIARSVPEAVRYACVSWPMHLMGSGSVSATVSAALLDFCAKHLLHWLEVLSLLGELSSASNHVLKVRAWCQVSLLHVALMPSHQDHQDHRVDMPWTQEIAGLLRDVYRVLQMYADAMVSHALQVYQSVLATVPHCRLLDYTERGQIVTPRLLSQRSSDWSSVVKVIEGHAAEINSAAYSPDGTCIVSGSDDGTVRMWDAHTGRQLAVLEGHMNWVESVAFSPDGAYIISGSDDRTVRVWDVHSGKQLAVLEGHSGSVFSVAFSPDGAHIVSGSYDETVRVWNAHTGKQLAILKNHRDVVNSVAYSPDGTRIISGSDDETVRVWDAHTGKQLAVLKGHTHWVESVAFSPDGAYIVSGSSDRTVRVWDAHTGKQFALLEGHMNSVRSVGFSPDGAHIVSGSIDDTVWVWDAHRTVPVWELVVLEGHTDRVSSVAFSPDGARIVSGSSDMTVRVWDAHTRKQLEVLKGHKCPVMSVSFSPDGKRITSKDKFGNKLAWNVQSTLPLHEQFSSRVVAHTLSDEHEATSVEGPIAELQPAPTEALVWDEDSGWISWQCSDLRSIRLCWLPHERRGMAFASRNKTAVIGARRGAVTILDFSEVIATIDAVA
jgi:WD40 repeat protein